MLVKSFHSNNQDKKNRSSTYTVDTYDTGHPLHLVASLEPAMLLENNHGSFSNSMRFSSGPSTTSSTQNRNTATTLADSPLPSPGFGNSYSKDTYIMMNTSLDRSSTSRLPSTNTSTDFQSTINNDNSTTSFWKDEKK
jgi:hypothetical protein